MKFIIKPPRCGKTTELIKLALEESVGIVVANEKMREALYGQAWNNGVKMPRRDIPCFTANEIKEKRYRGSGVKALVIDNIEIFLNCLFPDIPTIAISGTEML
jgi:hypothetical protein